jgi:hypothetical protein
MVLVGILLVSGFALIAVESVGYLRGGYNSAFWRLPLDDKLDHVAEHRRDWWWISIWSLVGLFTVSGGLFGFASLLVDGGEPVLAYVALGGFVVSVLCWVVGVAVQGAAISEASKQRTESGVTPEWVHPFWSFAFLLEVYWIVGSNVAFSLIGVAILQTGVVADWAGWVALIGGAITAVVVLVLRDGFPQLGILLPAVIGIALLIEAV